MLREVCPNCNFADEIFPLIDEDYWAGEAEDELIIDGGAQYRCENCGTYLHNEDIIEIEDSEIDYEDEWSG